MPKRVKALEKIDPKHDLFAKLYFMPKIDGKINPLFGNAYQSALEAGFAQSYAIKLTNPNNGLVWVREGYAKLTSYTADHIVKGIEDIAFSTEEYTRDRLKAFDSLAKIKGMYIDRVQQEVSVTFTNSVPRPEVIIEDLKTSRN